MNSDVSARSSEIEIVGGRTTPQRTDRAAMGAAAGLALLTLGWLVLHLAPATMSPDANGYVAQARLIATEGKTHFTTVSPAQYVGMHWLETTDGVFRSRYPAGLPVLMAAAWKLGGLEGALFVNPLLASLTVMLVFLLARRCVGEWLALLAAAVYATNATVQQHALDADAHVAAAFFLTGGVLALLKFEERRAVGAGLAAGVLLGAVPTVRYPEALAGVAIGVWLLWRVRPVWRVWPVVLGAALPIGALCVHNAAAYGAFWRTGYALTNEQTGFAWSYFAAHWLSYLQSLGGAGLGVFFAFGAAGLAGMVADARHRAMGVLFAGIVAPLLALYMAYYFGTGESNLRFLVPLFPLLAVAGGWLLARVSAGAGVVGRVVIAAVIVLQLLPAGAASSNLAARMRTNLRAAAKARTTLEQHAARGSVVIVDRQLGESLDAAGGWRLVEESLVGGMGPGMRGGPMGPGGPGGRRPGGPTPGGGRPGVRPTGMDTEQPSPMQPNKNRAQRARYGGLAPRERQTRAWADIRELAGGQAVFWFVRSLESLEEVLPEGAEYEALAEIEAPAMMGPAVARGGPMLAGGMAPGGGGPMIGPGGRGAGGGPLGRPGIGPAPMQSQTIRLVKIRWVKA